MFSKRARSMENSLTYLSKFPTTRSAIVRAQLHFYRTVLFVIAAVVWLHNSSAEYEMVLLMAAAGPDSKLNVNYDKRSFIQWEEKSLMCTEYARKFVRICVNVLTWSLWTNARLFFKIFHPLGRILFAWILLYSFNIRSTNIARQIGKTTQFPMDIYCGRNICKYYEWHTIYQKMFRLWIYRLFILYLVVATTTENCIKINRNPFWHGQRLLSLVGLLTVTTVAVIIGAVAKEWLKYSQDGKRVLPSVRTICNVKAE